MSKRQIKYCGLTKEADIEAVNQLDITHIGFVFAKKSRRYVTREQAKKLKALLRADLQAVGVFVNEDVNLVAELLEAGIIDIAQLHGQEDEAYIETLRRRTGKPIIKAFCIHSEEDVTEAQQSSADWILLDSGTGSGEVFDWGLLKKINRPYFLAGGLSLENVRDAVLQLQPFGLDVSSGIETDGAKDPEKMKEFLERTRL